MLDPEEGCDGSPGGRAFSVRLHQLLTTCLGMHPGRCAELGSESTSPITITAAMRSGRS